MGEGPRHRPVVGLGAPLNFTASLIVLGLGLNPTGITAQLNDGGIHDNYLDFEACKDFLAGD